MSILDTVASQLDDLNIEDAKALDELAGYYAKALAQVQVDLADITNQGGGTTAVADKLRELEKTIVQQYQTAGIKASTMTKKMVEMGFDSAIQDAHEKIAQALEDHYKALGEYLPHSGPALNHIPANAPQSHPSAFTLSYLKQQLAKQGKLDADGNVTLYHVTPAENLDSIAKKGLVPGEKPAPGQTFKATHSGYATYFHSSEDAIYAQMQQIKDLEGNTDGWKVLKAKLKVDSDFLKRLLPDEDVSLDPAHGFKALIDGEGVAIIGGVNPSGLSNLVDLMKGKALDDNMRALLRAGFGQMDPMAFAAFQNMFLGEDSPLFDLVSSLPAKTAKAMYRELRTAVLTGQNPKLTARKIAAIGDISKNRALTIARTEQLRAYRQATAASYRASKVVTEWVWHASLDRRCCFACASLHGTVWPKDELMRNHPNCRCAMVPKTKSWADLGFPGVPETSPIDGNTTNQDPLEGFPDVKVNIGLRSKANQWLQSKPPAMQARMVGGPGQLNLITVGGLTPPTVSARRLNFNPNKWGGHFSQKPLSDYGSGPVLQYSESPGLKAKAKAGPLGPSTASQAVKQGQILQMQNQTKAFKEASAKKYSSLDAKKAALKKAAGSNKELQNAATLDTLHPQGPAPTVPGSPSPSTGSQTTGKPKPGSPEFKQKVSEAVKAANAKKKAAAEQAAKDAAAAQAKKEAEAEAVAQKAMMAAKVSHGVKVANAKKNGTQPPPLPNYDQIKADAKAAHLAGQPVAPPPKTAKAAPAPKPTTPPVTKHPVGTPLTGITAYEQFKAESKPGDPTGGAWFHVTDASVLPLIEKLGFKPQVGGTTGFTGVKLVESFDAALGFKPSVVMLKTGPLKLAKAEQADAWRAPLEQALKNKIAKAEAKYGPDSEVVKKLRAVNTTTSPYWGQMLKKTQGIDGFISGDGVLLTNMKLANKSKVASYQHTQPVVDELNARAAKAQAAEAAKARAAAAKRAAERKALGLTDNTFAPFDPKQRTKLHDFIKKEVTPARPAVNSAGHPIYLDDAGLAKHSVMTNLASRLQNNGHWNDFVNKNGAISNRGANAHESMVSDLIGLWAQTSFDTNAKSVAMQLAAIEEFGLRRTGFDTRLRLSHMDTDKDFIAEQANVMAYRAFLRAMYEHTQEQFAAHGITHISGYRGAAYWSSDPYTADSIKHMGGNKVESGDIGWQPMSSWSSEEKVARNFATGHLGSGGDIKVIHTASIPVERVIGTTRTGYGCLNEWEVVVMDTEGEVTTQLA